MPTRKPDLPWRKVLYKKQHYPDNYVDPSSFLSALRRSQLAPCLDLVQCLLAAGPLVQELSLCCLCISLFAQLDRKDQTHNLLPVILTLFVVLLLVFLGLVFWNRKNADKMAGNSCVFLLYGYGFSPVLKNLTSTISTDTIYAMVTLAFLLHLFVQDYGAQAPLVSTTLAFNASLFAAVCLASRLQSILQAFTLLTFCAGVFAGSPMMHRLSRQMPRLFQAALTLTLSLGALASVATLSWPYWWTPCVLLLALMLFLGLVCPLTFHRFQAYKESIFGPWDEAVVVQSPSS